MNLAQIDLNLLLALDALLAERNLTRAGRRLGLSQPSMSRALDQLRRIFDDQLLVRVGREYQATALALELQEPLTQALGQLGEIMRLRLVFDPQRDERLFRVAASHEAVLLILNPLIERLSSLYPAISLMVRQPSGSQTVRDLETGRLELGIWPETVRSPELECEVLYEDRWVFATWRGVTCDPASLTPEQLARRLIAYDNGVYDHTGLELSGLLPALPKLVGGAPARLTFTNPALRLLLLRGTPLVDLTHRKLALYLQRMADVEIHDIPFEESTIGTAMYWHNSREGDPALVWLRNEIRAIVAAPGFGLACD